MALPFLLILSLTQHGLEERPSNMLNPAQSASFNTTLKAKLGVSAQLYV